MANFEENMFVSWFAQRDLKMYSHQGFSEI